MTSSPHSERSGIYLGRPPEYWLGLQEQYEGVCRELELEKSQAETEEMHMRGLREQLEVRQTLIEDIHAWFQGVAAEEGSYVFELADRVEALVASNPASVPYCTCPEGADGNPCAICGKPEAVTSPYTEAATGDGPLRKVLRGSNQDRDPARESGPK